MNLFRTSILNGLAVATKMITALILNKILAVYVGPTGYAVVGQFQNAMTIAIGLGSSAISNGVTKMTAENFDDEAIQRSLWRTAGTLVVCASVTTSALILVFQTPLAVYFLKDPALSGVFTWLAVSLIFISLNALLLSILNGKKEVHRFVASNIMGSVLGLGVVGLLTWNYQLYGALVAFSIYQAVVFFVTLLQCRQTSWFKLRDLFGGIDREQAKALGHFAFMAIATAILVPSSQIIVRNHLGANFGWNYAGYWDATWRISMMYLMLITTTLSLYWLPRIAEIRTWTELKAEIIQAYKLVLPAIIFTALAIYLLRHYVITLLFTPDFAKMEILFAWQLAGDVLKIGSWILAFLMIGKGLTKEYIFTETAATFLFCLLAVVLCNVVGFQGVAVAHFFTYAIYWLMVYLVTVATPSARKKLFRRVALRGH